MLLMLGMLGMLGMLVTRAEPRKTAMHLVPCEAVRQTQITSLDVDAVESFADGKILDDSLEASYRRLHCKP